MNTHLNRYLEAQQYSYAQALSEIKSGFKRSHWMWYIFPQIKGLGTSSTSIYYAIQSLDEAKEYLNHPILKERLFEITQALLEHQDKTASEILGGIDALKLKSSMTLFHLADPDNPLFIKVIHQYFQGNLDESTLHILKATHK